MWCPLPGFNIMVWVSPALPQRDISLSHTVGILHNHLKSFNIKIEKLPKKDLTLGAFLTMRVKKLLDF